MTTVLYVHGLESGPRGKKAIELERAGFTVISGQMPCNRRAVLTDPVVVMTLCLALAVVVSAAFVAGVIGLVVSLVAVAVAQRFVRRLLMKRMVRRSVDVQRKLLAAHHIDVVVGSSFGGAIALQLLESGLHVGAAVLLCPAHELVAARGGALARTLTRSQHVVVVHGRQDETVPIEHSRSLTRGTQATLLEVDDDHRLTANANAENLASWVQRALTA